MRVGFVSAKVRGASNAYVIEHGSAANTGASDAMRSAQSESDVGAYAYASVPFADATPSP